MRIIAYEDEDFKLEYTKKYGDIFIHCLVFNWSLSSLKKGKRIFEEFKEKRRKEGVDYLYSVTPNPKFCELLGGHRIGQCAKKNREYEVYRWELKQPSQQLP